MTIKDQIKGQIGTLNPLAILRRNGMRKQLVNRDVTFLAPNCIGGILFHDLGLKFLSPTVNLMMTQTDFLQFVLHMDAYLEGAFSFFKHAEYICPCAILQRDGLPNITVHFTHYASEEEALKKWNERKKRIKRSNIFIFIEERDGITHDDLLKLSTLSVKGIVAFTCHEYPDIPYSVYIPKYHAVEEVGDILKRHYINDSREYERYFDFVKWFNEADGGDFSVQKFKL